ncbi:MAG: prolipoprotein diacylglyceryl transferase family protein, partial [Candidatus Omnitrophota bacterium]
VQICDALILGTLFLVLRFVQARRRFTGQVFFLYVIFYAASRFIIEFFRGDNPVLSLGLTFSQIVSAILLVIGIAVYYARSVWASKRFG